MTTKRGFTKVDNSILFNSNLSNNSKLIYIFIKHYSSISNFKLSKSLLLKDSGLSKNTLEKSLKELKEKGLIFLNSERHGSKNIYWYSLLEVKDIKTKQIDTKPIDSDGNTPLKNQLHIDDIAKIVQNPVEKENKLTIEERLVKATKANIERVRQAIKYAEKNNAVNVYEYALKTIKHNWDLHKNHINNKVVNFCNFKQREYDYDLLEKQLLGWDNDSEYELPF
ncbi:hypothetical protein GNF80_10080 [Clostridium perfringens]|nr:hypothetical protein [Clostridium perfringens]